MDGKEPVKGTTKGSDDQSLQPHRRSLFSRRRPDPAKRYTTLDWSTKSTAHKT